MDRLFLEKFEVGKEIKLNNQVYEILEIREDFVFFDYELNKPIKNHLYISLHKKEDTIFFSDDFLLVFYEEDKIIYNKRIKKEFEKSFIEKLRKLKVEDSINFEGNKFKIKKISKSISKTSKKGEFEEFYNYVLVSYLNKSKKISLNVIDYINNDNIDFIFREINEVPIDYIAFL
jgi:hypothetical protein